MHIAAGADDRFAMPMAVTLYSALANLEHGSVVSLYVLDGGISRENKRRLAEVLNVDHVELTLEWLNPDLSALCGLTTTHVFSQAAYLRLLIPELLPGDIDRVIYLDSDLIVERDLGELWQSEMGGRSTLAVKDYLYPYVSCVDWAGETYTAGSFAPHAPYCNTGVLVMDLEAWRTRRIARRAVAYMQQFPQFVRWADQDGMNVALGGDWGLLDDRWNVMLAAAGFYKGFDGLSALERQHAWEELLREPWVLHFTGPIKPWRFVHPSRAACRFFEYLQQSNWFEGVSERTALMEHTWSLHDEDDRWMKTLAQSVQSLEDVIPEGESFILVDEATWPGGVLDGRYAIPFLEANGRYAGIPPDDVTAIREFERLQAASAHFIVFVEPALWWLDYFGDFHRHLRDSCQCLVSSDQMVAFRVD
jgi:lipopolysaccharide biosynthesis glycosyltransferase